MRAIRGIHMKQQTIDLSQIYLKPLTSSIHSFIKAVGSGTGLGKTYSSVLSLKIYIAQSDGKKPVLAIFTAPQHNHISFPDSISKELENLSTTIMRVKPISSVALSNIDSEFNAYDAVRTLFFNSDGRTTNAIYNGLVSVSKKIDDNSKANHNPTKFQETLSYIKIDKLRIDSLLDKLAQNKNFNGNIDDMDIESRVYMIELQKNFEDQQNRLQDSIERLAKNFQYILSHSYKNTRFYREINEELSTQSLREFREVSSTFYPFLHYQLSGETHALMGMTISKLLTQHDVFYPIFTRGKNLLRWGSKKVKAEDIINDTSEFSFKSREVLNIADEQEDIVDTQPSCRKLFDAEVHIYIDESDASKSTIGEILQKNLYDRGIIQAMGAVSKESGSVLYDPQHIPLLDRIPNTDLQAYRYLTSGDFDDAIERQVGKDILRKIQDSIIHYVSSTNWDNSGRDPHTLEKDLNKDIRFIARAMLSAPYCTVEAGVERSVFEMTSVFGGEMFGFIGSRNIDNYAVIVTPSSIRITKPEYLTKEQQFISLRSLFLLITIEWFIFLSLSRRPGGPAADKKLGAQFDEQLNNLLNSGDSETASHHVESFKKFIKSLYSKNSGGLFSVAKPFRPSENKSIQRQGEHRLHTICALDSIVDSSLLGERFEGVFSPMNVDIDELLGESTEYFSQEQMKPIDINYGYCRAHTIYGMTQVHNPVYMIAQDKSHVAFPIKYRRESAESYLIKLVSGKKRRVCCFLMSATGAYENSHIPAWSMDALEYLAKKAGVTFLRMDRDDYAITAAKQQERGKLKQISFQSLDDFEDRELHKIARNAENICLKKYRDNNGEGVDGIPNSLIYQLQTLSNHHKRRELNNILKGLDYIHHHSDYGDTDNRPRFALALAQTHQKFSAVINLLSRSGANSNTRHYFLKNILSSTQGNGATGAGYAIYELSGGSSSKFGGNRYRDTLIICYSVALDKALAKIYKEQIKNPNSLEYKLKLKLGMKPEQVLPEASATDFNAMNYFLSHYHKCNVYIVSAYRSAARGINLIVNKKTKLIDSIQRQNKSGDDLFSAAPEESFQERDLDYIFMAAPPFYSEIRLPLSNDMGYKTSQERFFVNCERYFHYLEWAGRHYHGQPENQLKNTEIDLMSPIEDPTADEYFKQQHAISIFSELQQALGRIERTNAQQSQIVFLCDGVNEVIHNGIEAITHAHDDKSIDQLIGAMSVVNSNLIRKVLNGEIYLPLKSSDNSVISTESQHILFENLKRENFLKAIQRYRDFDTASDIDENTLLEIEFYEAFRSTVIWTKGYQHYIKTLNAILERMPKGMKWNYRRLLKLMFTHYEKPLDEYISLSGIPIDLDKQFENKVHALTNPYYTEIDGVYIYPAPWFLPDLEGNYGEFVTKLAIEKLILTGSVTTKLDRFNSEIARKGYELADFFVRTGNHILAIDAKHYLSLRSQFVGNKEDYDWTLYFTKKLQRNQKQLESLEDDILVRLAAINAAQTTQGSPHIKSIGIRCYLINSNSELDSLVSQLGTVIDAVRR